MSDEKKSPLMKEISQKQQLLVTKDRPLHPMKDCVLLPRPAGNVHSLPVPLTQVIPSSSVATGAIGAKASGNPPASGFARKIFILGLNGVLYPAVVATAYPKQSKEIPDLKRIRPVQQSLLKQSLVDLPQKKKPSTISVVKSNPDTPVEEIQIKVEPSEFLLDEDLKDQEIATGTKTLVSDEGYASADKKVSVKRENANNEKLDSPNKTIKKVKTLSETTETSNIELESIANELKNAPNKVTTYLRKAPLLQGQINLDNSLYCDECSCDYEGDCPDHGPLIVVNDTAVAADIRDTLRAKKTAPSIISIADSGVGSGAWAREVIPARTRFGPFDGKIVSADVCSPHTWLIRLNGKPGYCIDVSEPGLSNWMRYVGSARRVGQENLRAFQLFGKLYFRTTREIDAYEELLLDDDTVDKVDDAEFSHGNFPVSQVDEVDDSTVDLLDDDTVDKVDDDPLDKVDYDSIVKADDDTVDFVDDDTVEKVDHVEFFQGSARVAGIAKDTDRKEVLRCSFVVTDAVAKSGKDGFSSLEGVAALKSDPAVELASRRNKATSDSSRGNTLSCSICQARFSFEEALSGHLKTHASDEHVCGVCSERCFDETTLNAHLQTHRPKAIRAISKSGELSETARRFCCDLCHSRFVSEESLTDHKRSHSSRRQLECDLCGAHFVDHVTLKKHLHSHKELYPCPHSDKHFRIGASLKSHLETKHGGASPKSHLETKHGDASLKSHLETKHGDASLKSHLETKHGDASFACELCKERFTSSEDLESHKKQLGHAEPKSNNVRRLWLKSLPKVATNEHEGSHKTGILLGCDICEAKFSSVVDLGSHLREHGRRQSMDCPECGRTFSKEKDLEDHVQRHERYPCTGCGTRFFKLKDLVEHSKTSNCNPYKCTECEASFFTKHCLVRHLALHGPMQPLNCLVCMEAFPSKASLNSHLRAQHLQNTGLQTWKSWQAWKYEGGRSPVSVHARKHPFTCLICKEHFLTSAFLNSHIRAQHPGTKVPQTRKS